MRFTPTGRIVDHFNWEGDPAPCAEFSRADGATALRCPKTGKIVEFDAHIPTDPPREKSRNRRPTR